MRLVSKHLEMQKAKLPKIINWRENYIGEALFYSYRSTLYNRETYPSSLHYHDYYELVILEEGEVEYVCESEVFEFREGDIMLIPPNTLHMSRITSDKTLYKRHVFYLYPNALDSFGGAALTDFLRKTERPLPLMLPNKEILQELFSLLKKLDKTLERSSEESERALSLGLILQIFYLLKESIPRPLYTGAPLPESILKIKQFVDGHFTELSSVSEVAEHFFYSREHISRLFKKHFNTTIADYIRKKRISESQALISRGMPITEACFRVGFQNLSSFNRAFHSVVNTTPSEYRKIVLSEKS